MMLFSKEKEKRDAVIAGPTARCTDATVCARPFVAPSLSLGAAEEIYMNIHPYVIVMPTIMNKWTSTKIHVTTSTPTCRARVPLIGKKRNAGRRPDMNMRSARRSPRNLTIRWKKKNGRMPVIIPNAARQVAMRAGSKPSPPNSMGVVYTNGTSAKLEISRYAWMA